MLLGDKVDTKVIARLGDTVYNYRTNMLYFNWPTLASISRIDRPKVLTEETMELHPFSVDSIDL